MKILNYELFPYSHGWVVWENGSGKRAEFCSKGEALKHVLNSIKSLTNN